MINNEIVLEMDVLIHGIIKELEANNSVTIRGCGNSMYPYIDEATDTLVLKKVEDIDKARAGEIYLYRRLNGKYSIHRIYKIHDETADMVGDGQVFVEQGVPKSHLIAVVSEIIKPNGRVDCLAPEEIKKCAKSTKQRLKKRNPVMGRIKYMLKRLLRL